jgi:hypothetical protein
MFDPRSAFRSQWMPSTVPVVDLLSQNLVELRSIINNPADRHDLEVRLIANAR